MLDIHAISRLLPGYVVKETVMSALIFFLLFLGTLILFLLPDERATANDEIEEYGA